MSENTFASHTNEVGAQLKALRNATTELGRLFSRHTHNGYSVLVEADFDNDERVKVTKAQYDAALASINNLLNTWLPAPAGNGTNIDQYLYGVPEVFP